MTTFLQKNRKAILAFVFFFFLFVVFFLGKKFDPTTGESSFVLTSQGVTHFRKGLDVSGGVRFTYKADFSEYKAIYQNVNEYNQVRRRILDIILKNMDNRISALGVSDYNAFVQYINGEDYVVVEIGGLKDIEQAKKTIGKTVELEFKLMNEETPTAELAAKRKTLAEKLLIDVTKNPSGFKSILEGRGSDDVYYNSFNNVKISELPEIYARNIGIVKSIQSGQILDRLLPGLYHTISSVDGSGNNVTENLEGFLVVKGLGITKKSVEVLSKERFKDTAIILSLNSIDAPQNKKSSIKEGEYVYSPNEKTLTYNNGVLFSGKQAYNIQLYKVNKPTLIGKSEAESAPLLAQAEKKALEIKANLSAGKQVDATMLVTGGWNDADALKGYIGDNKNLTVGVSYFDQYDSYYVLKVNQMKTASEQLYDVVSIVNVSDSQYKNFQENIQFETLYSFEEAFIRNKNTWVSAKDAATSQILNGAFFKFASIDQSQLGNPVVTISFNEEGKTIFCNITSENIGKQMAIFVGGELQTAPKINDKICGGSAQIEGGFTLVTAKELITSLNEGAMPVKLIVANEEKISPTLGEYAIQGALLAGAVGFVFIFLMLWFIYGIRKAFVGLITLTVFIVVLFGVVKLTDYALSLSGIAAIVLTLGMAVDANILIFERVVEELATGKTMKNAIDLGYDRSWAAIRDGNLSTGLIAFLLFMMGTNVFKGFGAMMIVNMIMILLLNVPVTVELLHMFFDTKKNK